VVRLKSRPFCGNLGSFSVAPPACQVGSNQAKFRMAGEILTIMPKRLVDFATLASGASVDITIAERFDILRWREVTLVARIHTNGIGSGAGSIFIAHQHESWTDEDPTLTFLETNPTLVGPISSSTAAPTVISSALTMLGTPAYADGARFFLRGNRAAAGTIRIELSLELDCNA
jgi:hypothetical protein